MDVLMDEHAGGATTRRLLPIVIVVPVLIALGCGCRGNAPACYDTATGTLLFTCSVVVSLAFLVWWSGRSLSRSDEERRRAEEEVRAERDALAPARGRHAADRLVGAAQRLDRLRQSALVRLHGLRRSCDLARQLAPVLHPDDLQDSLVAWMGGGGREGVPLRGRAALPARLRRRVPVAPGARPARPRRERRDREVVRHLHRHRGPEDGHGGGGAGEPRQERVPGQHEPRDPHADERHHRADRAAAGHAARRGCNATTC